MYYLLLHIDLKRLIGDVGVPGLNREIAYREAVTFPESKNEQKNIAGVLGLVQQAIEQQHRLLTLTAELKRSLLHNLFTKNLRGKPQKQADRGWQVRKLGEITKLKSGGTPSRSNKEYWEHGTIPWVKTGEVDYCVITDTEEHITPLGLANSSARLFPAGTLLMAMYGQGVTRGRVAMLGTEAATNQACVAFFPSDQVRTKFLYYYFEHHYDEIRNLGHGANQKNLSADILKSMSVSYPDDTSEQDTMVSCLEPIDSKLILINRKIVALDDLFRTLMHQLMSAQLCVRDLDITTLQSIAAE